MAQTVWQGEVKAHPSGVIEVSGVTEKGREVSVFLSQKSARFLHDVFALADREKISLGHADWHIREGRSAPCSMCHYGEMGDQNAA